jgi:lysozyme family protein
MAYLKPNQVYTLLPRESQLFGLDAAFLPAYQIVSINEGGLVNNPADKGGLTYAGIAYNFNPTWEGWTYIQFKARTEGVSLNPVMPGHPWFNKKWADVQYLVTNFYETRWNANRFGEINNQALANLLFDYQVNSGSHAIKAIQRLLGVKADGIMGPITLNAINSADAAALHDALKAQRAEFYKALVAQDSTQGQFLSGWLTRLSKFPDQVKQVVYDFATHTADSTPWGLLAGGILLIALSLTQKTEPAEPATA